MSTIVESYTVESEGVTVSRIVWNRFRRAMPGMVERIYDLNQGLADLPIELPVGTKIMVPIDAPSVSPAMAKEPVQLWS